MNVSDAPRGLRAQATVAAVAYRLTGLTSAAPISIGAAATLPILVLLLMAAWLASVGSWQAIGLVAALYPTTVVTVWAAGLMNARQTRKRTDTTVELGHHALRVGAKEWPLHLVDYAGIGLDHADRRFVILRRRDPLRVLRIPASTHTESTLAWLIESIDDRVAEARVSREQEAALKGAAQRLAGRAAP